MPSNPRSQPPFSEEYVSPSNTQAGEKEMKAQELQPNIDPDKKYGISKPIRRVIRGKIVND